MKSKIFFGAVCFLAALALAWALFSWADITAHNLDPAPVYAGWNLFTLIF